MKKNYQNGCIHIIIYLLIFTIFIFTVYACLDILNIVDVPEKYSVEKWISDKIEDIDEKGNSQTPNNGAMQNIYNKVKVEIGNLSGNVTSFNVSKINGYSSKENEEMTKIERPEYLYYNQLDKYAKIIYDEFEKNLDNMKTGTYNIQFGRTFNDLLHEENGEEVLNNSFQLAINALNFDNPELFYLDVSKIYLLTRITTRLWVTTYEVEIGTNEDKKYLNESFNSEFDVKYAIKGIENEKNKIKDTLKGDTENQIKGVHDYLIENLEYDETISKDNIYNIYGALINKVTVCEGYARSFKAIMDDLGIPCIIVCGTAVNSNGETENHAWNYVQLDGKWYAMDITWDDPIIIGNGYVGNKLNYNYYLKGSNEFFENHTEDGNIIGDAHFKYPTLSVTNY